MKKLPKLWMNWESNRFWGENMDFFHKPVLTQEILDFFGEKEGYLIDGTLGGGGHSKALLEKNKNIKIIGLDKDPQALKAARENLASYHDRLYAFQADFRDMDRVVQEMGVEKVSVVLLDLGVSSHQLDSPERGFSYHQDGPLDMRMDPTKGKTAADLINSMSVQEMKRVFKVYGEEKNAGKLAKRIDAERRLKKIKTTRELARIVSEVSKYDPGGHPARRVFQALRIAVNEELEGLEKALQKAIDLLLPKGRLGVITFHSLEDKIVKRAFRELAECNCPKNLPCVCGGPEVKILTRKPISPAEGEIEKNRRARSAKLRVVEKL